MRKKSDKKLTRGMPSAVLLSIIIHAGLFMLAGMLVVFTVVKKEEQKFEPPKAVERPKMKLKKPKVKVKKSSKPKSTTRIVTKANRTSMPDIQLPEMSGMGGGLGDAGLGGFDLMPVEEITVFGNVQSIGNDLEGTFYDFNRKKNGLISGATPSSVAAMINKFFAAGWKSSVFRSVYQADRKLYATSIPMHITVSDEAPDAFNEPEADLALWLVHYTGKIVYPEDITFRFWAYADDIVAVRVDGEMVILACFNRWITDFEEATAHFWQSRATENRQYPIGNSRAVVGDWITLKAGEAQDIEILIGENQGGIFGALLLVEVKDQKYPLNPVGQMPILPLFKTEEFSRDMIENIYWYLQPGEGTCVGGPVFNDFHDPAAVATEEPPDVVYPPEAELNSDTPTNALPDLSDFRVWRMADGQEIEAKYKTLMRDTVLLESKRGKQKKVAFNDFSAEDQKIIAFANPPRFDINFTKSSNQISTRPPSRWLGGFPQLKREEYTFGFQAKQNNDTPFYNYPLTIEYFAVGDEVEGNNFILMDRHSVTFQPSAEGGRRQYDFESENKVGAKQYRAMSGNWRGTKYGGYLVVVRDMYGNVIQHKTSNEFLFDSLDNLLHVPISRHFNRDCNRVMPPRPKKDDVPSWR